MKALLALWFVARLAAQSSVDLANPESPALSLLGGTPAVIRPATPPGFATSLVSGSQTAMSVDIAPYWLAAGSLIDRQIYKSNPIVRLLAGTQLSIATAKAAQLSDPSRLTLGFAVRIWDRGDPRLDDALAECLQRAAELALKSSPPCTDCADDENARREALLKNTCRDQARARNWNRSSWAVGGAKDTQSPAALAWTTLAYGFEGVPGLESTSQFMAQWSRRNTGVWQGGVRLRVGNVDTHVSLEWTAAGSDSKFSIAAERRVGANLWLDVTAGGVSAKRVFVLTSFNWSLAKQ